MNLQDNMSAGILTDVASAIKQKIGNDVYYDNKDMTLFASIINLILA